MADSSSLEASTASRSAGVKRALCLINRNARAGDGDIAAALNVFAESGVELLGPHHPADQADARRLVESAAADVDAIIIGGGDGTLSGLAGSLLKAGKPIGILPLGTANDLARSLDIPPAPELAAEVIVAG